jgi:nitrate reductase assembly molybdenum cofactor insertion protein NarJ
MDALHYDALATLFAHPGANFGAEVQRAMTLHQGSYPSAGRALDEFSALLPLGDPLAMEELYTRTFDVQAITSLDIGYTLFGEDYKRGALLANLSREHTLANNDCGMELADHLTNVLRLLPRLTDAEIREEFVRVLVAPALREMIREFEPERLAKKEELYKKHHKTIIDCADGERRVAYRHALEALLDVLQQDFSLKVSLPMASTSKFEGSVGVEMNIEDDCGSCAKA